MSKDAQDHKPNILFLETKLEEVKGFEVLRRCGFQNGWEVPHVGLSGGLLLG